MTRAARLVVVLAAVTVGCGGADDDADRSPDGISIRDAWTRPSPATVTDAAVYVTLQNVGVVDDRVVAVGSERCVTVVPHVTRIDGEGVASMNSVGDALTLPAGGSIEMEPNALHLMCLGLDEPLAAGDSFAVDIDFAESGLLSVPVAVEDR